jgi:hypothetical protein
MLQSGPFEKWLYKDSVSLRGYYWRAGINMFLNNPVFGVGIERYGANFKLYRESGYAEKYGYDLISTNAHNVPIQFFATGGFLLGTTYLILQLYVFLQSINKMKNYEGDNFLFFLAVFCAWLVFQFQSIVSIDNYYKDNFPNYVITYPHIATQINGVSSINGVHRDVQKLFTATNKTVKKLYNKAKSKGSEFVSAIPETTRQKYNLRASEEDMQNGDDEEYECEDCGYEGGEAEKCPECGSENYDEKEMEEEAEAEELTAENLHVPSEEEYLKAEEINLDPSEFEELNIEEYFKIEVANAAEYQGRKVTLNKPFRTPDGPKKSAVYVKNSNGKVVIVRFGDKNMSIKKNIPARRKSFRARHKCDQATDKTTPRYWACKSW